MVNKGIKLPLITASDAVDEDFVGYLSEEHSELHKLVREKKYTVKNTDTAYRVINHWEEKGILPEGVSNSADGWRKFSLIEILWLEAVKKFREFGLPLETIKTIRVGVLNWNEKEKTYPWFEYYALKSKTSGMDGYIVATEDGNSTLAFSRQIESAKIIFSSRSFILISFKELLSGIGLTSPKPECLFSLSSEEQDLLDTIRNQQVDKVSLKIKGGKVKSFDASKTIVGSDIGNITKEIKEAGDFADVLTKFERGKEQSVEVKKKRKF